MAAMRTVVYVDGQNFLYKAADVLIAAGKITEKQALHTISLRKLLEQLLKDNDIEIRYCGTKLKKHRHTSEIEEKSKIMIDSQRRLRNSLAKQSISFVESGKLKVRDGDKLTNVLLNILRRRRRLYEILKLLRLLKTPASLD